MKPTGLPPLYPRQPLRPLQQQPEQKPPPPKVQVPRLTFPQGFVSKSYEFAPEPGTTRRNISAKDYLQSTDDDQQSALLLKSLIRSDANDTTLLGKLVQLLEDRQREALHVRPEILDYAAGNNRSIENNLNIEARARKIIDSINQDGAYFKFLVAAANFIEARRQWNSENTAELRNKYSKLAKKGGKTKRRRNIRSKSRRHAKVY